MSSVRTRFAPSPTGYLHIGGVRTALFCWLYVRHHGGQFILRIEDTDRERSTQESVDAILQGMEWMGLSPDEGPFYQTDRIARYQEVLDQLLDQGLAYKCYCTQAELDQVREDQRAKNIKPRYNRKCRDAAHPEREGITPVIRFRNPLEGSVIFEDLVRGKVNISNDELDDLVIARGDGMPTYNFAVVVDDIDMEITHVIRGDDHVNNTPRQVNIFKALNAPLPIFAHLPMIVGQDGQRLSKRHGAVSVLEYRDQGFLPEAMRNYLLRLGWSHGDQEIFSRDELIKYFSFDSVNTSAAIFDADKLSWVNEQYIQSTPPEELAQHLEPHLVKTRILSEDHGLSPQEIAKVIPCLNQRAKTLVEMAEKSAFFFKKEVEFDEKARNKFLTEDARPLLKKVIAGFSTLDDFSAENIETLFKKIVEEEGMKLGKLAQPVRVALTGTTVSPGIYDVILLLGKEETLKRLQNVV